MKKIYNVGILGSGHIAEIFHIPAWLQNKNCRVVALCDKNQKQLKKVSKKFKIKNSYMDYSKMIKDNNLDIVNICTPPNKHFEGIKNSIKSKKNMLVEKPFVLNTNELKELKKILKNKKNLYIQCALHQRFRPISIAIKKEVEKKTIGDIYYINIIHRKFRGIPKHSQSFSNNRTSGGGPLIDLGSHYFDLIAWMFHFPKIKDTSCSIKREIFNKKNMKKFLPFKLFNNEEICLGNIKFANNIHLNFELGYALNTKDEKITIEMFGTKGSFYWPEKKFFILKNNKLIQKKFNYKETKASFNQVDSFIKRIKRIKGINTKKNINEYHYIAKLIDMLYKSGNLKSKNK